MASGVLLQRRDLMSMAISPEFKKSVPSITGNFDEAA
jgi:hypothetical protein